MKKVLVERPDPTVSPGDTLTASLGAPLESARPDFVVDGVIFAPVVRPVLSATFTRDQLFWLFSLSFAIRNQRLEY